MTAIVDRSKAVEWWWIDTRFATGGIGADPNGVVVVTAPIFRWMLGQPLHVVLGWKRIVRAVPLRPPPPNQTRERVAD